MTAAGRGIAVLGVAALAGCGGGTGPVAAPDPVPTVGSSLVAAPQPNDVSIVSADPAAGATISLAARSTATVTLSVNVAGSEALDVRVFLTEHPASRGSRCQARADGGPYGPGNGVRAVLDLDLAVLRSGCGTLPRPMSLDVMVINTGCVPFTPCDTHVIKQIPLFYTVAP